MNRQEFVDRLRAALNGRIAPALVEDNVRYYQEYIAVEMRKGRSEQEVLESLGDPRLIARTIIGTSGQENRDYVEPGQEASYDEPRRQYDSQGRIFHLPRWLLTLIIVIVAIVALSLIFSVLSFFAPLILVMAAVIFMVKLFRDWLN